MRTIIFFHRWLPVLILFTLSGCIFHKPAYYPAEVLMKEGIPCFFVANKRKERANPPRISNVVVYHHASDNIVPLWYREFFRDQLPMRMSPKECLFYGVGGEVAQELKKGVRYGVSIRASIDGHGAIYKAYFCLYENSDGQTGIHHAKWNDGINGYDWRVCEQ